MIIGSHKINKQFKSLQDKFEEWENNQIEIENRRAIEDYVSNKRIK